MTIPDLNINARDSGAGPESGIVLSGMSPSDVIVITKPAGLTYDAWSAWPTDDATWPPPPYPGKTWLNRFQVTTAAGTTQYLTDWFATADAAFLWVQTVLPIHLTGHDTYTIWINDPNPSDNRGGFAIRVEVYQGQNDMNPAHMLREVLSGLEREEAGQFEADISDEDFQAAADQLHMEGMGMSLIVDRQTARTEELIRLIEDHIDGVVYVDRHSGKYVLKLIRNDYDPDALLVLDESNVVSVQDYAVTAPEDLINSVTVNYWDASTGKDGSVTAHNSALIKMQKNIINTTVQYPGFTNPTLAARVAVRDLRALSTPLISCTIYTNRAAAGLNRGSVFRLRWPDYAANDLIMRVVNIELGDGRMHQIRLTCVQDIFSLPDAVVIPDTGDGWVNPSQPPEPLQHSIAFEVPYLEMVQQYGQLQVDAQLASAPDASFIGAAGVRVGSAINTALFTNAGAGYGQVAMFDLCPSYLLTTAAGRSSTVWSVGSGVDMDLLNPGTWAQINSEIVEVVSYVTGVLTVRRGLLDTVPVAHAVGSRVYCWDEASGYDPTEYAAGENVSVKLCPVSGQGQLPLEAATPHLVTLVGRAARPYPPGRVQVNGMFWPAFVSGPITLTWAHRNRVQQTANTFISFEDGDVTPEPSTTYTVQVMDSYGWVKRTVSGITGNTWTYAPEDEVLDFGGGSGDPYWEDVTLLLPLTGTVGATSFTDLSEPPKVVTTGGNVAVVNNTPALFGGYAASFDGNSGNNFLSLPQHSGFAFDSNDFTFEVWVYPLATPNPYPTFFDSGGSWGTNQWSMNVDHVGAPDSYSLFVGNYHGSLPLLRSPGSIVYDQWTHVAFTRQGDTWQLFVNGVLVHSVVFSGALNSSAKAVVRLGTNSYKGSLREARITKGLARYTADFAVPPGPFPTGESVAPGIRRITLESVRDGLTSYQRHDFTFERS